MIPLSRRVAALLTAGLLLAAVGHGLAQDEGDGNGGAPPRETVYSLILKGGAVMIPLGIASVLALAMAVERLLGLRHAKIIPPGFIMKLREAMTNHGDEGVTRAIAYCESVGGPVGNIFKVGLARMKHGQQTVEKSIEDAGGREVDKLKRSLRGLAVIASVSPLLGLLGTVYGMISAFQDATVVGMGKADTLARGIYEALVTTAAGLTIAIPALLVFQYLNSRVDALVDEIDEMGIDFMASCVDIDME